MTRMFFVVVGRYRVRTQLAYTADSTPLWEKPSKTGGNMVSQCTIYASINCAAPVYITVVSRIYSKIRNGPIFCVEG